MADINGYRVLTDDEVALINRIKSLGHSLENVIDELSVTSGVDNRWVAIGKTDLQKGMMALVRAVARPTGF